jgi:hypothetical protein
MAYKEMTFTQRRMTRVSDGAGGKIETPVTLGAVTGRKHFYQKESKAQLEREQDPARAVKTLSVVIFDDPTLDIAQHDLLVEGDLSAETDEAVLAAAVTWTVNSVRAYDFQTQADVELVA